MTAKTICGIIFLLMLAMFLISMIAAECSDAKARKARKHTPGIMLPTIPQGCIDALRARTENTRACSSEDEWA